jgi:diguanylate cyclase (GGDEF)-like protein/PAS domain S-box-containing protein
MSSNNKPVKSSSLQVILFVLLILLGGALVMLADLQANKKEFLRHSDLIHEGVMQRLLTAEGVITALVSFGQSDDIQSNDPNRVLDDLVQAYPYIYSVARLDWIRLTDRSAYEREMQENGMAGMVIREYNDTNNSFIRAFTRKSYLVTRVLVPLNPRTSQLLGLDLLINKEIANAVALAMKGDSVSLVHVPEFLSVKPGLVMLKNTYYGRLQPESLIESKQQINGAVMLYIDQEQIIGSVLENFSDIDLEMKLIDFDLSDDDIKEPVLSDRDAQDILSKTLTFSDHRIFKVANRDVIMKVRSQYQPGTIQIITALAVMLLIALALRTWKKSREQNNIAKANQEEAYKALFKERERAEVTLSSIADAVVTVDDHQNITFLNPVAENLLGCTNEEALDKPVNNIIKLYNEQTQESVADILQYCVASEIKSQQEDMPKNLLERPDDKPPLLVDLSCSELKDMQNKVIGSVIVIRDVTHEMELKEQLTYQANHDSLTGLVNRSKFEDEVKKAILSSGDDDIGHSLCYMDLDQFKIVNDTCGHIAGDALLKQLSGVLNERTRDTDVLARLGGDEFGLLLRNCDLENAMPIADTLRQAARQFIFSWEDHVFDIGMSIGVVAINDPKSSHAELMSAADVACYIAKESGRDYVHAYTPEDKSVTEHHELMQWSQEIQDALRKDRFYMMLQTMAPLLSSQSNIQIQEFLLRMRNDDGSIVTPSTFIPAAERYGLMREIDMWVVDHALEIIHDVQQDKDSSTTYLYSINLSGQSIGDPEFSEYIVKKLEHYQIIPNQIMFEITETAAITNYQSAMDFMDRLSEIGCRFALDDFGAGLSSFGYLKSMKVDFIKIDGQFVKGMAADPIDQMMVNNITHLAYGLGLFVIAESVEDVVLMEMLRDIGVHFAQGYHIQQPTTVEDWKSENKLKTIFIRTLQ